MPMFDASLSTILNNGLLGAMLVLALLVIWWMQKRYDNLLEKYDQKSQHNYDQIVSFKDIYHKAMSDQTETQRLMTEKLASISDSMKTIAAGMYQSFYTRNGRPDA